MEAHRAAKSDERVPQKDSQAERSLYAAIRELLGLQELLTTLMVVATISAAIATWKATQIYARGARPYVGVDSIRLSVDKTKRPYVAVNYRDLGSVPARETVLEAWSTLDGKVVSYDPLEPGSRRVRLKLGILSPEAAHMFAAYFQPDALEAIRDGKSQLKVSLAISYQGAAGESYCYRMDFRYYAPADTFDPYGGSDNCRSESNLSGKTAD
jgi:hypothetical protein